MRLKNKIAIITGGASGIGKTTAETFCREGATAIIWDVDETEMQKTHHQIKKVGGKIEKIKVDTSQFEQTTAAAETVYQQFGKIDILINNAGILRDTTLLKMTEQQWQSVIDVNLTGVFNCTKAVAPFMVTNQYGRIISASSVVGLYGNFGQTNYVASKAGVIGMTKVWARELGYKGITVNAIAPGFIVTEMINSMPKEIVNQIVQRIPLGKMGDTQDIANAYLFLASDEASFINGTVLSVDGGMTV